jgi:hypothetical protein
MDIVAKVALAMETILGPTVEEIAQQHQVIKRKRKFSGQSLLRMIVFTLLKKPNATFEDMALTAAQLGVSVSATAVEKRFTDSLADFLRDVLSLAFKQMVAAEQAVAGVLERFTAFFIGDSSSVPLPDELQQEFPGCGGLNDSGLAALKIQVRWNLKTGELPQILIEIGKASDAKSLIAQQGVEVGSLEIFDLGYFSLERFRRLDQAKAYYVSRLQHGTTVLDEHGQVINLRQFLAASDVGNVVDLSVLLGINDRLPSRLIAVRVPQEVADRRRQKARAKASKHGRTPSAEYLELLGWSLFITNLTPDQLTWKEAVVLYRARWQIELLFKLWKSHNQIASHRAGDDPIQVKVRLWGKLLGVMLQHWLLLSASWIDDRRSLRKAARFLRDWINSIIAVLDHHDRLIQTVTMLQTHISRFARIQTRKKHPSNFQLLQNPELLDWNA